MFFLNVFTEQFYHFALDYEKNKFLLELRFVHFNGAFTIDNFFATQLNELQVRMAKDRHVTLPDQRLLIKIPVIILFCGFIYLG